MALPPHHANSSKSLFQNPWETVDEPDENATTTAESAPNATQEGWFSGYFSTGLPSLLSNIPLELARDLSHHKIVPKKVVEPKFYKYEPNERSLKATWLGHAVSAMQLPLYVLSIILMRL